MILGYFFNTSVIVRITVKLKYISNYDWSEPCQKNFDKKKCNSEICVMQASAAWDLNVAWNQVIPNLHLPQPAQSRPPPYEPQLVFPVLKNLKILGLVKTSIFQTKPIPRVALPHTLLISKMHWIHTNWKIWIYDFKTKLKKSKFKSFTNFW